MRPNARAISPSPGASRLALPAAARDQRVEIDEAVGDRRIGGGLRHVAGRADEAPRRHGAQHLALAVDVVRNADHWRADLRVEGAAMAAEAAIAVEVDLVIADRMRDDRRLLRIVAA